MPTPIPLRVSPPVLVAAAGWTLLLLGLFVMHGAGSHGTTGETSPTTHVLASPTGHDGDERLGTVAAGGHQVRETEHNGGSPGHSAAEICLAILCALLPAIAAFGALARPRSPRPWGLSSAVGARFPSWPRPPDPPCWIRLSKIRC